MTEDVVRLFFVLVPLSKNKKNLKGRHLQDSYIFMLSWEWQTLLKSFR